MPSSYAAGKVFCLLIVAGLGHDEYGVRELSTGLLEASLHLADWRGPMELASQSTDPEVRLRAAWAWNYYDFVYGDTSGYPDIANLQVPPEFRDELQNLQLLAIVSETSWGWWQGMAVQTYNLENRQRLTEAFSRRMIRTGLSRSSVKRMLTEAWERSSQPTPEYGP